MPTKYYFLVDGVLSGPRSSTGSWHDTGKVGDKILSLGSRGFTAYNWVKESIKNDDEYWQEITDQDELSNLELLLLIAGD